MNNKNMDVDKLFSPVKNSTCSLNLMLSGISFHEEELTPNIYCHGRIVGIDSNFGHKTLPFYRSPKKKKESNRGRKCAEKPKSSRKMPGDGTCFNSQITFVVVADFKRLIPEKNDDYTHTAIRYNDGYEYIQKEYKMKLFRTGRLGIPGVIHEDYSDLKEPVQYLINYLKSIFKTDIKIIDVVPEMKNYKFHLLDNQHLKMEHLHYYCNQEFQSLYNTSFQSILEFISCPYLIGKSPKKVGWVNSLAEKYEINWKSMFISLDQSQNPKNIYVAKSMLSDEIQRANFQENYSQITKYINVMYSCNIPVGNELIISLIQNFIRDKMIQLYFYFVKHDNNRLSYVSYDKEQYPGLKLKIPTPTEDSPNKRSTVKIFQSGKINVDGKTSGPEVAQKIRHWLAEFFIKHDITYDSSQYHTGDDSDFSMDSSDSEESLICD